jgi:ribonuclease HI
MEVAQELGVKILEVRSDSQVVALQIRGEYEARGEKKKQFNSTRNRKILQKSVDYTSASGG